MKHSLPKRLIGILIIVCLGMIWLDPGIVSVSLVFGILSGITILRQREALYLIVLVSWMIVFLSTILGDQSMIWLAGGVMVLQLIALIKLSYLCFGAVVGGGCYKK